MEYSLDEDGATRDRSSSTASVSTTSSASTVLTFNGDGPEKKNRRKSRVYQYLKQVLRPRADGLGLEQVWVCTLCQNPRETPEWSSINTTNVWKHLNAHHPVEHALISTVQEQATRPSAPPVDAYPRFDMAAVTKADSILVRWLVAEAHPFSLVGQKLFVEYSNALRPEYVVPCRQTVADKIEKTWFDYKQLVQLQLRQDLPRGRRCSITTDMWTSPAHRGYEVVTLHYIDDQWKPRWVVAGFVRVVYPHTGERLAEAMVQAVDDLHSDITSTIWTVSADNASNNGTMMTSLSTELAERQGSYVSLVYVRCLAHVLQLAVKEGLKRCPDVNDALGGLREVVKKLAESPKLFEKYAEVCGGQEPKVKPVRIRLDVPTRWNSTFEMIDGLLTMKPLLEDLIIRIQNRHQGFRDLSLGDASGIQVTPEVWKAAELFHSFLGVFKDATVMMSASTYPTMGAVVSVFKTIEFHVDKSVREASNALQQVQAREIGAFDAEVAFSNSDLPAVASALPATRKSAAVIDAERAVNLFSGVQVKLQEYKHEVLTKTAKIAGALDPRFRSYTDEEARALVRAEFFQSYSAMFAAKENNPDVITSPPAKFPRFLTAMAEMTGRRQLKKKRQSIDEELEDWLQLPDSAPWIPSEQVCEILGGCEEGFPRLTMMAREYLAIPATSVPSEGVFSKAGHVIDDKRTRLDDSSVRAILELQSMAAFLGIKDVESSRS